MCFVVVDGTRNIADRRPVTPATKGNKMKASLKTTHKSPITGKKRTKREDDAQFEGESPGRQGKTPKRAKTSTGENKDSGKDLKISAEDQAAIDAAIASDSEDNDVMDDVDEEEEEEKESKQNKQSKSRALVVSSKGRSKKLTRKKGKHSDGNWWKDKRGMYCKYDPGHPNFIRVSETDWRVIQYEAMDPNVVSLLTSFLMGRQLFFHWAECQRGLRRRPLTCPSIFVPSVHVTYSRCATSHRSLVIFTHKIV